MATKAERYRSDMERSGAARPKTKGKTKAKAQAKAKKKAPGAALSHPSQGRKAMFAFEETPKSVPRSRKSTRRSANHQKAATTLTSRNTLVQTTPRSRHDRGGPGPRAAH
jgi:hypothetical protein